MGYGARDFLRIKLKICLDCGEEEVGRHRRCLRCRRRRESAPSRASRDRHNLKVRWVSYVHLKTKAEKGRAR